MSALLQFALKKKKKALPSSCQHLTWTPFSNHLRPAVVFGKNEQPLAYLAHERFVLASSFSLVFTNVLSVSLRGRSMLLFQPGIRGRKGKFTIHFQGCMRKQKQKARMHHLWQRFPEIRALCRNFWVIPKNVLSRFIWWLVYLEFFMMYWFTHKWINSEG